MTFFSTSICRLANDIFFTTKHFVSPRDFFFATENQTDFLPQKIKQKTLQIATQKEALTRRILVFAILMIFEGCP